MWSPSASPSRHVRSNLQNFLRSMTPIVPARRLHKNSGQDLNSLWHLVGKDTVEYFTLGDLWKCYDECSAYGAGTPVVLNNGEEVVQYYTPHLSAIQIYINKYSTAIRTDLEVECSSDDSESDQLSRSLSNNSSGGCDVTSADSSIDQEVSFPMRNRLGYLYFQYYDTGSPFWRTALFDKISEFVGTYPGIVSLKSVDLSPASWMAVAWYPIYHIPTKLDVKDLSACFLTYHTLSSWFQENAVENVDASTDQGMVFSGLVGETEGAQPKDKGNCRVCLPPFGLTTYKMQRGVWLNQISDYERLVDLHSAADSWLKQLNFQHPDYNFFTSHSTMEFGMFL